MDAREISKRTFYNTTFRVPQYHLILMNELYFKDEETESQSGELVLWPITHVIELSLLTAYALILHASTVILKIL